MASVSNLYFIFHVTDTVNDNDEVENGFDEYYSDSHDSSDEDGTPNSPVLDTSSETMHDETTEDVATKYLIKIREQNKVSQRCTLQIAGATELYIRQSISSLKRKIDECLADAGIDVENVNGYEDSFANAAPSLQTLSSDLVEHHRQGDMELPFVVNITDVIFC